MCLDPYIAALRRRNADRRAQREAELAAKYVDPRAALRARITAWLNTLPPDTRPPNGFTMDDLVRAHRATPQALGLALAELGWSRRRIWSNTGPFRRYWSPPSQ